VSIRKFLFRQCGDRRKFAQSFNVVGRTICAACLFLAVVSPLTAEPAKAKEATTKQSPVVELKPSAASIPANAPADPVVCLPPSDADASKPAAGDDKANTSSSAKTLASDSEASAESGSDSSAEFMKDKLKLSLGGKSSSASDQPQQCGIDEAAAVDKDQDKEKEK
jgi:hypothetical protein